MSSEVCKPGANDMELSCQGLLSGLRFPSHSVAGASTLSRRSQGHLLWVAAASLPALRGSRLQISPSGGCLFTPCLLSSLKEEFCYSPALSFFSKDSCEGELRGSTLPRSSCCARCATFVTPALEGTGGTGGIAGWSKRIPPQIYF